MSPKLPRKREGTTTPELLDLKRWKKLQELLAELIGANVSILDSFGSFLTPPTQTTPFCSDFVQPLDAAPSSEPPCCVKACQHFQEQHEELYVCSHGLGYASTEIQKDKNQLGLLVMGPLLVGGRAKEEAFRKRCEKQKIDPEVFCDRIREITVFSHRRIRLLINFFKTLFSDLMNL